MERGSRLELMHHHVRNLYRTLTGTDLPPPSTASGTPSFVDVERHFVELEALARALPGVAEQVAPFFARPPFDLIAAERELVIEVAVPGVVRSEVDVELQGVEVAVQSVRVPQPDVEGQLYHAEIARGPFRRVIRLPEPATGAPRIEVENGIIRIRLARAIRSPRPSA